MRLAMRNRDEAHNADLLEIKTETKGKLRKAEKDLIRLQADKMQLRTAMDAQFAKERDRLGKQIKHSHRRTRDS